MNNYDVIIIGAGPAGMTAGIYAARAGMKVLIMENKGPGGQVALTSTIQNYPGVGNIDGFQLSQNMWDQMTALGVTTEFRTVDKINFETQPKTVVAEGVTFEATAIILSMGASARGLGIANEKTFIGKGLSYCAVCDGMLYKGKNVVVVGGGNSALEDVLYLANIAKHITLVHRRDSFRAEDAITQQLYAKVKEFPDLIDLKLNCVVSELSGENKIQHIKIRNVDTNKSEAIDVDGVFVAIGRSPQTELLDGKIKLDAQGYIIVDENMATNISGVYAAGDIVHKTLRQIATAISDGAVAGTQASVYCKRNKM